MLTVTGKGSKQRVVPIGTPGPGTGSASTSTECRPHLARWADGRDEYRLLLSFSGRPLERVAVWQIVKKYAAIAQLRECPPAHAPAQLRDAPGAGGRRPERGAGAAGPRRHRHDPDLHARRPQRACATWFEEAPPAPVIAPSRRRSAVGDCRGACEHSMPHATTQPIPCILVIFGASGDLTSRKLVPAMYEMAKAGLAASSRRRILGVSRSREDRRAVARGADAVGEAAREGVRRGVRGASFAARVHYFAGDAAKPDCYPADCKAAPRGPGDARRARSGNHALLPLRRGEPLRADRRGDRGRAASSPRASGGARSTATRARGNGSSSRSRSATTRPAPRA
jgi:hypothetical protein